MASSVVGMKGSTLAVTRGRSVSGGFAIESQFNFVMTLYKYCEINRGLPGRIEDIHQS